MNAFFFLLHRELHQGDLILDSISRLQRKATATSTSGIDRITFEYPFFPCPGECRVLQKGEIF